MSWHEALLCKYGEMALKGLNIGWFEDLLLKSIRTKLKRIGNFSVRSAQCTVYIEPDVDSAVSIDAAYAELKNVFGISGIERALAVEKDIEAIKKAAAEYLPQFMNGVKTFRVDSKRGDKSFPLVSPKISAEAGAALLTAMPELKVDLTSPDITVRVEVRDRYAYISAGQIKAQGGMPYKSNGKGMVLLSGGIDSPVAAYLTARRGVEIHAIHFDSIPYTSERAREKVISLAEILTRYVDRMYVHIISLTHIQEEIRDKCDESCFTIVLRRFMMRLAEYTAKLNGCGALVTGESIGQVASQTLEAIAVTDAAVSIPVLRPCICMDKEDIVVMARTIGTYETSILPFEDCCTVFTPRHPRTRPTIDLIEAQEQLLNIAELEREAIATLTTKGTGMRSL
jgi:thiamine biosynthesis protein ThiI